MPLRTDVRKILVIGSGPIQIGQGCEFDYSGTQACLALKDLGFDVALVNSNPATIMTDTSTAHRVYIEPLTLESILILLEKERPDAVLPTVGGQIALNLFLELESQGHLSRLGIQSLGVTSRTVVLTEDRKAFRQLLQELNFEIIRGDIAHSPDEAKKIATELGFPMVVRTSFSLGGANGGVVITAEQLNSLVDRVFKQNPSAQMVLEESIVGWKEYELEVMRDSAGTFVVVCGVENVNPMGVHTGDSITCAPCMTLTDREYQNLRDMAQMIFEKVGMETGGANIQFAVHPNTGRVIVVEMNPRVSRSSALVSKATGYPIARLAAQLAVGLTLAELKNEITQNTTAAFEPSIDYVVVKIPRWDFAKYKGASDSLGVQMKSVGEVLAFGRTFRDAFQKAWRSLEIGVEGWPDLNQLSDGLMTATGSGLSREFILEKLTTPTPLLFPALKTAFQNGFSLDEIHEKTKISRWFLHQLRQLVEQEVFLSRIKDQMIPSFVQGDGAKTPGAQESHFEMDEILRRAKQDGFTHHAIAQLSGCSLQTIMERCKTLGIRPTFKMVDSCAGEFEAKTPYYYKTFEHHDENIPSNKRKIVILGSGPNRIGQGVEFDYSCVHAVRAAQDAGFEVILVNCNPETVSTDHRVSDKLFIEPLHREDVLDILHAEKPEGVFVQFGGQSPLKLAKDILDSGFKILGTPQEVIELSENRDAFGQFIAQNNFQVPPWATGVGYDECLQKAEVIGYPLLVRPSYVLGGRAMKIVHSADALKQALAEALEVAQGLPILLDKYLDQALEFDVDLVCDGFEVFIPAIMEHVEEAGVHSGDSTSIIPCLRIPAVVQERIRSVCGELALKLGVRGLLNVQLALHQNMLYILEVNPRSSRSVPFVSKSTGVPLAWLGARVALGARLNEFAALLSPAQEQTQVQKWSVKAPVFPFHKFPGVSPHLGPEMRSIGEVMGTDISPGLALAKAYAAAGWRLNSRGILLVISESQELQRISGSLRDLTDRFNNRIYGIEGISDVEDFYSFAENALRSGEISLVLDLSQNMNKTWRSCASRIGALTTQCFVPFLTSVFALDAWVKTLTSDTSQSIVEAIIYKEVRA